MLKRSLIVLPLHLLLCCYLVNAIIPSSGCTLQSPTPTNKICGKTGDNPKYVQLGDPIFTYQTLNSVTECQDLCLRRADSGDASCVNFSYDSSSSLCTITPEALTSISKNAASTVIFYERACFACPQVCSQQVLGQDLLDNSGFDISPKYLGPWFSSGGNTSTEQGGDIQGIQKGGKDSKRSYFCTAGGALKCSIRQSFTNCPTTVYKWSYDYKAASQKFDSFYATAYYGGGTSHSLQYPNNSAVTLQWQTYSDLFQLNSNLNSSAMVFDLNPGKSVKGKTQETFLADNIKIEPTDYVVGHQPGGTNTLPYGGFEQGTLAPWTKTKHGENLTIVSPGIMKEYALKWTIKDGESNPSFGIMLNIPNVKNRVTQPGMPYLFNVDFVNNLPQGDGIRPLLYATFEIFTGNTSNVINIHNKYSQYHDGQVGTVRMPFQGQINQNVTRLTFSVVSEVPKGGNYYLIIDDISFKPLAQASSSSSPS